METVFPIPIPSIFIYSSSILIISPDMKDVTPVVANTVSKTILLSSSVVMSVLAIGDWIMLSIASNALVFCFLALNVCDRPIPTEVMSIAVGDSASACSAVTASLILDSLSLITNRF